MSKEKRQELSEEYWVVLDGLPRYAISNYGRVYDTDTDLDLETYHNKNGHVMVDLENGGKTYHVYVHRLVARVFFLQYHAGCLVRHLNGNYDDNSVLNLTLRRGPIAPQA